MQKNISIIYLDRNKFYCIFPQQIDNPILYNFSPQTVKDFEVLNKDLLYSEIHAFIKKNRLSPYPVIIILSNTVIFEKDLSETNPKQLSEEITLFLEKIPFETIVHKIIKINKKTKVIATNKIYLDLFKDAFERDQCKILLVLPESVCDNLISQKGLNREVIKKIIDHTDSLKQHDLSHVKNPHILSKPHESVLTIPEIKSHTRLIMLLFVFTVLMGTLILLFFISKNSFKNTVPKKTIKSNKLTPSSTSIPTLQTTSIMEIPPPLGELTPQVESSISASF
ncbi:MAG TPA: hypothetical protein VJB63_02780 [Patescibacteria group bacterium]|nr:hypothetical protein [Patescibacteria group bacterium]